MIKKLILGLIAIFAFQSIAIAQQFARPVNTFSKNKIAYITLNDGDEVEAYIKKIKRKKGLIKFLSLETEDGEKLEYSIEDINFAYLPQHGLDKLNAALDQTFDMEEWDGDKYNNERLKDGYAFFETTEVMVKKKKMTLLMQLLNPGATKNLKVYHDPFAQETMSVGVGPMTAMGGYAKSYYFQKGSNAAVKMTSKDFRKERSKIFSGCDALDKKYRDAEWKELDEMCYFFNTQC